MIPLQVIRGIKKAIIHQNGKGNPCPDGVASALLIKDALPNVEIVFASHHELELSCPVERGLLFCDVTPPKRSAVILATDYTTIVLDHHVTAKDIVANFKYGVYADEPCISGAMLAFRHVWSALATWHVWSALATSQTDLRSHRIENASDFARLAGVRDTWQKDNIRWVGACEQAAALRFYPFETFVSLHDPFGASFEKLQAMLSVGEVLMDQQRERNEATLREVYRDIIPTGQTIGIVNTMETSDLAEMTGTDILVGFKYHTRQVHGTAANPEGQEQLLTLSLRSRGDFDVGALAKRLGGGGHKNAAGCTLDIRRSDPYTAILNFFQ